MVGGAVGGPLGQRLSESQATVAVARLAAQTVQNPASA